jgi:hypothetical protein
LAGLSAIGERTLLDHVQIYRAAIAFGLCRGLLLGGLLVAGQRNMDDAAVCGRGQSPGKSVKAQILGVLGIDDPACCGGQPHLAAKSPPTVLVVLERRQRVRVFRVHGAEFHNAADP